MKIEQIRENISLLINEIVSLRKERDKCYCVDVESMNNGTCIDDCDKCKEQYYKNMEEYLNNKYNV